MKNATKIALKTNTATLEMVAGACGITCNYASKIVKELGVKPVARITTGTVGRPATTYAIDTIDKVKARLLR
jgi:hypothetical protein